jgi:uncharacterized protein YjiS (DUF1127 family)
MFNRMRHRVRQWRRYRRTLAELEIHSDRDLAELGLLRCDLPRVARETARS